MSSFNKVRIQTKRDTASNWEKNNPVLLSGEMIIVDTNAGDTRFKIGDGSKRYSQLPFQDEALYNVLNSKQDTLAFDSIPTSGSSNPVTSGGIADYIANFFSNIDCGLFTDTGIDDMSAIDCGTF